MSNGAPAFTDLQILRNSLNEQGSYFYTSQLADGGVIAVWENSPGSNEDIVYQRFAMDGSALGPRVTAADDGDTHVPAIAELNNGNLVVTYQNYSGGYRDAVYKVFDSQDNPISSGVASQRSDDDYVQVRPVALPDGGFVVTSSVVDNFPGMPHYAKAFRVYTEDGSATGSEIVVDMPSGDGQRADVFELDDDRMAFIWMGTDGQLTINTFALAELDNPESNVLPTTRLIYQLSEPLGTTELVASSGGMFVTFNDGGSHYISQIASDGSELQPPAVLIDGLTGTSYAAVSEIPRTDHLAVLYSWRPDGSTYETFAKVVSTNGFSTVGEPVKVADALIGTDSTIIVEDGTVFFAASDGQGMSTFSFELSDINVVFTDENVPTSSVVYDADAVGELSYQWFRDGIEVEGATGSDYMLTDEDQGSAMTVEVARVEGDGTRVTYTSNPTASVHSSNEMSNYYLNELNGHYYTYVTDSGISWDEASTGAQSMSYAGYSGYLATITTESEMQFVDSVVFGSGRPDNTFVGGSDAYQEGVWRWVTGPEGLEADGAGRVFFESGAYVGEKAADWINYFAGDTDSNDYLYIYSWFEPQFNPWNGSLGSPSAGGNAGYLVEFGGLPVDVEGAFNVDGLAFTGETLSVPTEFGMPVDYSVTGADADKVLIDADDGEVRLKDPPDYEAQSSYQFTVTASGADASLTDLQVLSNDLNEQGSYFNTAKLADGNVVAVWDRSSSSAGDIVYQRFGMDGSAVGPRVGVSDDGYTNVPAITELANGNLVVTNQTYVSGNYPAVYKVFDPQDNLISSGVASQRSDDDYVNVRPVALDNGGFLVTALVIDNFPGMLAYGKMFRLYDDAGSPAGDEVVIDLPAGDDGRADAIELDGGRLAFLWRNGDSDGDLSLLVYDSHKLIAGEADALVGSSIVHDTTQLSQFELIPSSGGGVYVLFNDNGTHYLAEFGPDGSEEQPATALASGLGGASYAGVTEIPGTDHLMVLYSWQPDGSNYETFAEVVSSDGFSPVSGPVKVADAKIGTDANIYVEDGTVFFAASDGQTTSTHSFELGPLSDSIDVTVNVNDVNESPVFATDVVEVGAEAPSGERVINAYTTGDQSNPVAINLDGAGFFVAWVDKSGLDGNSNGVYGRFLDTDGQPVGTDVQISGDRFASLALDSQEGVRLTQLASGEILAVWQSGYHQDGSYNGIYAQRIGTDGTKIGDDFLVNQTTRNSQSNPDVVATSDGGFVAVWNGWSDTSGIYGRHFNADGTPGDEFRVDADPGSPSAAEVTELSNGDFAIIWLSSGSPRILEGKIVDPSGNDVASGFLNEIWEIEGGIPSVTALGGGRFLTLWSAESSEHAYGPLYGQIFNPDGSVHQAKFRVADFDTTYGQGPGSATVLPDGSFVVSFSAHDNTLGGYGQDVYYRHFDEDGLPLGDAAQINIVNNEHQHFSSIANDGESILITWRSSHGFSDGSGDGIVARVVPLDAAVFVDVDENTPISSVVYDADATDADGDDLTYSVSGADADKVTIDADGGEVRFNESPDYETRSSYQFTVTASDGELSDSVDVTVNVSDVSESPSLARLSVEVAPAVGSFGEYARSTSFATLEGGSFGALWSDESVYFQRVEADGTRAGTPLLIAENGDYQARTLASLSDGSMVAAYRDRDYVSGPEHYQSFHHYDVTVPDDSGGWVAEIWDPFTSVFINGGEDIAPTPEDRNSFVGHDFLGGQWSWALADGDVFTATFETGNLSVHPAVDGATSRTFQQFGRAYSADGTPVSVVVELGGQVIFSGTVPTGLSADRVPQGPDTIDFGEQLFSWTQPMDVAGTSSLQITVSGGELDLMATSANYTAGGEVLELVHIGADGQIIEPDGFSVPEGRRPRIEDLEDGTYLVAWGDQPAGQYEQGLGQVVRYDGTPVGEPFALTPERRDWDALPEQGTDFILDSIGVSGHVLGVFWEDVRWDGETDNETSTFYVSFYDLADQSLIDQHRLGSAEMGPSHLNSYQFHETQDGFLVLWDEEDASGNITGYGQSFGLDGSVLTEKIVLAEELARGDYLQAGVRDTSDTEQSIWVSYLANDPGSQDTGIQYFANFGLDLQQVGGSDILNATHSLAQKFYFRFNDDGEGIQFLRTRADDSSTLDYRVTEVSGLVSSVEENTSTSTVIFDANAADGDGDDLTYSVSGNDADKVAIDADDGEVRFSESPDYETQSSYQFTVTASDGELSDSVDVTLGVVDQNEFGLTRIGIRPIDGDQLQRPEIDLVQWSSEDGGNDHYYGIKYFDSELYGSDAFREFMATRSVQGDFEGHSGYVATITSPEEQAFIDQTLGGTLAGMSGDWPSAMIGATDLDEEGAWRWFSGPEAGTLLDGGFTNWSGDSPDNDWMWYKPEGEFLIVLDYRSQVLEFGGWNDGAMQSDVRATHPYIVEYEFASALVAEDLQISNSIGVNISSADADGTAEVTYSLTNDAGGLFAIDPVTGDLSLAGSLDYETATSHQITIQASSSDGSPPVTRNFTIEVTNSDDPTAGELQLSEDGVTSLDGPPVIVDVRVNDSDPGAKTLEFVFDRPVGVTVDGSPVGDVGVTQSDLYIVHHNVGGGVFGDRMNFSGGVVIESGTVFSIDIQPHDYTHRGMEWPADHHFSFDHNNNPTSQGLRVVDSRGNDYPLGDLLPTGTIYTGDLSAESAITVESSPTYPGRQDLYVEEGAVLSAVSTLSDPDGIAGVSYQWESSSDRVSWAEISGATSETYSPDDAEVGGYVRLKATVTDGLGNETVYHSGVSPIVMNVNDIPTGQATALLADGTEDQPYAVSAGDLLQGFSDVDGDSLSISNLVSSPGSVTDNLDGTYTINPGPDFNGPVTLTYDVVDGHGGSVAATQSFNVGAVNDSPAALSDSIIVNEDSGEIAVDVLANDSDVDGDDLAPSVLSVSDGGSAVFRGSQLVYQPASDFHGAETVFYSIADGNGGIDAAALSVTVLSVNDQPVVSPDVLTLDEDTGATLVDVLANDTDVDLDSLTLLNPAADQGGSVSVVDNKLSYQPLPEFSGVETVFYEVQDGAGGSDVGSLTVTVNPVNDNPVATTDSLTIDEDADPVTIDVLANDSDIDGDSLTISSVFTGATGGTASTDGNQITFQPAPDMAGSTQIKYMVSDGNGGSDEGTVNVTINGINDAPVVTGESLSLAQDSAAVMIDVLANDTDADNDELTVTGPVATHGGVVGVLNNQISYQPAQGFEGTESIFYVVSDGNGGMSSGMVTVSVTASDINDSPVFAADTVSLSVDENIDTSVVIHNASATDADGDDLLYSLAPEDLSEFNIDSVTGEVRFNESPDYETQASYDFTVTASDGELSDEQLVSVQIDDVMESSGPQNLGPDELAGGGVFNGSDLADRVDGRGVTESLEVIGGGGFDTIMGGLLGDRLLGGSGNDYLHGYEGSDELIGGAGNDYIRGGEDTDTVVYDHMTESVRVDLRKTWKQNTGDGWDKLIEVENVVSGSGFDSLFGNDLDNELVANGGNDYVFGAAGNDTLIGGSGNDVLFGGSGVDTVIYDLDIQVRVNLAKTWKQNTGDGWDKIVDVENVVSGSGADSLFGNGLDNELIANAGNDYLYGGAGDDRLFGGVGNDFILGGTGIDTAVFDVETSVRVDLNKTWKQNTGEGFDKIADVENVESGSGNDKLFGDELGNRLTAGSGNDYVDGRNGDDVLEGGSGDDRLRGGDGSDVFRFYRSEGLSTDTITDFGAGDLIELVDDTGEATAVAQITDGANGSTVTWDELTIVLEGSYINYDDINPIE